MEAPEAGVAASPPTPHKGAAPPPGSPTPSLCGPEQVFSETVYFQSMSDGPLPAQLFVVKV